MFSFSNPIDDQTQEGEIAETSEATEQSEHSEKAILDGFPTFEDVTPDVIDEDHQKLGEPPQSGLGSIPIVQDVIGDGKDKDEATPKDVQDLPIVGDLMGLMDETEQTSDKPKESETTVKDLPVFGDIMETMDTVNKEIIEDGSPRTEDLSQTTSEKSTKSVDEASLVSPLVDEISPEKSIKSVQEASPISPLVDEIVIDSSPKIDEPEKDLEASPISSDPFDADEDLGSINEKSVPSIEEISKKSEMEDTDKSVKIDEASVKSVKKISDFDTLSDLTRDHLSTKLEKSVASHQESESLSTLSLSELQSHPVMVTEQYEAGTEVVAHLPDHHSMKTDQVAEQLVAKHLDDSSTSSSDSDSGVTKMELTNVDHNSDEQHFSTQHGTSSADSSLFGATSDSNAMGMATASKTVNTQISKVKFQHGRKWAGLTGTSLVTVLFLLIASG